MAARRRPATRPIRPSEGDELEEGSPLFGDATDLSYISVSRDEPDEGYVGRVSPAATERDIAKKWGGGTFTLSPRAADGKYVKSRGTRVITVAGDPLFQSQAAEMRWKRSQGLEVVAGQGRAPGGAAADKPLGFGELMMLIDAQAERSRRVSEMAAESRAREADAAHARQLELVREDAKRRERELLVERERLNADAIERSARLDREMAQERERAREHMSLMLQVVKAKGEVAADSTPMSALMAGVKLALDLRGSGGEGASDPLAALAGNLPEVLAEARKLYGAEHGQPAADAEDGSVKLEGDVAAKARGLIARLQEQGKDPAVELGRVFDALSLRRRPPPPQAPQAPPAQVPIVAPAPASSRRAGRARRPPPTPRPGKSRARQGGATR